MDILKDSFGVQIGCTMLGIEGTRNPVMQADIIELLCTVLLVRLGVVAMNVPHYVPTQISRRGPTA